MSETNKTILMSVATGVVVVGLFFLASSALWMAVSTADLSDTVRTDLVKFATAIAQYAAAGAGISIGTSAGSMLMKTALNR